MDIRIIVPLILLACLYLGLAFTVFLKVRMLNTCQNGLGPLSVSFRFP